jgi:hypothetical protein
MAKYKTTITEKDGTKSSGYIENGRSYYDNGKEINAGASATDAQGKTWTKGGTTSTTNNKQSEIDMISAAIKANNSSSGGSSYKPSYGAIGDNIQTNPYADEIDRIREAYERQQNQIREQNRIAVEQGTNRLNAQKANINQAAEDNARQAYIMHMQAKKALPQQLVNQGATGGMTETANLGLQTTYQNNLNDINRNKINAIQEIDNAIVDLKNTGNLATVEQVLANNQAALDSYMSLLDKGVAYNQWANQYNSNRADNAYTQAYKEREYADMLKQQAFENELAFAKNTQSFGGSGEGTKKGDGGYKSTDSSIANYVNRVLGKDLIQYNTETKKYELASEMEDQRGNEGMLSSQQVYNWYKDPIIQKVLYGIQDGTISANEGKSFLYGLGYRESDITRVRDYTFEEGE